jgi:hypothetical protein
MNRTKLALRLGVVALLAAVLATTAGASAVKARKHSDAKQDLALTAKYFKSHKAQLKGARGPEGPAGLTGTAGPRGAAGAAGATNVTLVRTDIVNVLANSNVAGFANCPAGRKATGGGIGAAGGGSAGDVVIASGPVSTAGGSFANATTGTTPVSWYATFHNGSVVTETVYIWAICAGP